MATKKPFVLKSFLIATLRRATYRFPPRYTVMNGSRTERGKYKCAMCKEIVGRKDTAMDHIHPVVDPAVGWVDWNTYIERMFVDESGWQCLCKKCHKIKGSEESAIRKKVKNNKK